MTFASSALMAPMSRDFVEALLAFAEREGAPLVRFARGARKEDIAAEHLARFARDEGVLFLGVAQEKTRVFRTERRRNPVTGQPYPWIVPGTAIVNHYYLYALDRDFGPFFLKLSSYFPYTGRLCFNGDDYLKRQAAQRGIALRAARERRGQLRGSPAGCSALPLRSAPSASSASRASGWRASRRPSASPIAPPAIATSSRSCRPSSRSPKVLDQPHTGRLLFEQLIRENLDLGRPDEVSLIFHRRIIRRGRHRTPGRFRTRIITTGVSPHLYVYYRSSSIKHYHKEGRALRTETTVNDAGDLGIASDCLASPRCGRRPFKPTDGSCPSSGTATTARSARTPSSD